MEVDDTISYFIVREWLKVYVYAGMDIADSVLEASAKSLMDDLRAGKDPRNGTIPKQMFGGPLY